MNVSESQAVNNILRHLIAAGMPKRLIDDAQFLAYRAYQTLKAGIHPGDIKEIKQ